MAYRQLSFTDKIATDRLNYVEGFPIPPAQPVAPFHALSSVFKLVANKEDTRQVFEIVGALSGGSYNRFFERFVKTPYGRRVVTEPVKLEEVLGRRDWLRSLPEGSLGRVYLDFMEGEDLTPDGIVGAANEAGINYEGETQFEELRRMSLHFDVVHDLWHVITGYGRDALGELCLLVYTRKQSGNEGFRLITWIGALAGKLEQPGMKIWAALKEAGRMGDQSEWIPGEDIEALLPLSLEEVRRKLNIIAPEVYQAIPAGQKENMLKPRITETQAEREYSVST